MEPSAPQVPVPPQSQQQPAQPQTLSPNPVSQPPRSGKGILILLGALLIVIVGGIISVVIVINSNKSSDPYATSQQAIAKAAEELQKNKVTPTKVSENEKKLKEIDNDLTNIDQENEEIDQGLKDSMPDLSIQ